MQPGVPQSPASFHSSSVPDGCASSNACIPIEHTCQSRSQSPVGFTADINHAGGLAVAITPECLYALPQLERVRRHHAAACTIDEGVRRVGVCVDSPRQFSNCLGVVELIFTEDAQLTS